MREEPKSLAQWLESNGSPKHAVAEGENGSMTLVVEDKDALWSGVTLYSFRETEHPNGYKHFWMSCGLGLRKEYLPALKKFLCEDSGSAR